MKRVENASQRPPFFPNQKTRNVNDHSYPLTREEGSGTNQKENVQNDAKVSIPLGTKIFSRIKSLVDKTLPKDNREKIDNLRSQIRSGEYQINEDKLANKVLSDEFEVWRQ